MSSQPLGATALANSLNLAQHTKKLQDAIAALQEASQRVRYLAPEQFDDDEHRRSFEGSLDGWERLATEAQASLDLVRNASAQLSPSVKALEFYANPEGWRDVETGIGMFPGESVDHGATAREALDTLAGALERMTDPVSPGAVAGVTNTKTSTDPQPPVGAAEQAPADQVRRMRGDTNPLYDFVIDKLRKVRRSGQDMGVHRVPVVCRVTANRIYLHSGPGQTFDRETGAYIPGMFLANPPSLDVSTLRPRQGPSGEKRLGDAFLTKLLAEVGEEKYAEIVKRNRAEPNPRVCHSHDFVDANMVMSEAFAELVGEEVDLENDAHTSLWGRAWRRAVADMVNGAVPPAPEVPEPTQSLDQVLAGVLQAVRQASRDTNNTTEFLGVIGTLTSAIEQARHETNFLTHATTALVDLGKGYPASDIATPVGSGLDGLVQGMVAHLRACGHDDEGAWDCDATRGVDQPHGRQADDTPAPGM